MKSLCGHPFSFYIHNPELAFFGYVYTVASTSPSYNPSIVYIHMLPYTEHK